MNGLLKNAGVVAAFLALGGIATIASHAEIVHHWALYAASGPGKPFHLFLEPFPDERTCRVESAAVTSAGGRSYCGQRIALTFDRQREEQLLWEFFSPSNPWSKLCGPRRIQLSFNRKR